MHVKVFKTIMKELNVMQRGNFMLFLGAHVIALSRDDIGPVSMILNAITSVEDHLNMTTKLLAKRETFESSLRDRMESIEVQAKTILLRLHTALIENNEKEVTKATKQMMEIHDNVTEIKTASLRDLKKTFESKEQRVLILMSFIEQERESEVTFIKRKSVDPEESSETSSEASFNSRNIYFT